MPDETPAPTGSPLEQAIQGFLSQAEAGLQDAATAPLRPETRYLRRLIRAASDEAVRYDVDARRHAVFFLDAMGKTAQEIAKTIGLGLRTIEEDLRVVRAETFKVVDPANRAETIRQQISGYQAAARAAWADYAEAETLEDRARPCGRSCGRIGFRAPSCWPWASSPAPPSPSRCPWRSGPWPA